MTTATEIQMMMAEGIKRNMGIQRAAERMLAPMVDRTMEILFGPKRKRWDRYGAYHRRQVKKWSAKNRLEIKI